MLKRSKELLRRTFVRDVVEAYRARKRLRSWERAGRPAPAPDLYKRAVVRAYGAAFRTRVLIESGTYLGGMVEATRREFAAVHSIELDDALFAQASRRFANARNVTIHHGDSGNVIGEILKDLREPALFWLDGHYSEGFTAKGELSTPIVAELQQVLRHSIAEHVILVDDARCFNGTDDYPTIDDVRQLVASLRPDRVVSVRNDILRIHAPTPIEFP